MPTTKKIVHIFSLILLAGAITTLQPAQYDESALQIFSKIAPRLVLLSSKKSEVTERIDLCIVYETADAYTAERFGRMIQDNAAGGKITAHAQTVPIKHLVRCNNSQLVFFFNTSASVIQASLQQLSPSPITVAYNAKLLDAGVDISLFFGRSVMPYINLARLSAKKITFDEVILRVSKIYVEPTP